MVVSQLGLSIQIHRGRDRPKPIHGDDGTVAES